MAAARKRESKHGSTPSKADRKPRERQNLPIDVKLAVLTESGYRCAVPTCRGIMALDMHHIWEVSVGGGDDASNLVALCPTCHALYHRGTIQQQSIYAYKAMLVAIGRAFDVAAVDLLLFLEGCAPDFLVVSGDGLLHFARLVSAGLAGAELKANNNWQIVTYAVNISEKGRQIIQAWKQGDRSRLQSIMGGPTDPTRTSTVTRATRR
jgi:hypothetical protein